MPLTIWIEWLFCVPLMAFVSILRDADEIPSKTDLQIIFSLFATIFFGFAMTFDIPFWACVLCLSLSFFSYGVAIQRTFFIIDSSKVSVYDGATPLVEAGDDSAFAGHILKTILKARNLGAFLLYVLPFFPILYVLCMAKAFDADMFLLLITVANLFAKFIFCSRCADDVSSRTTR